MTAGRLLLRLGSSCNNVCEHCTVRELSDLPERTTDEAVAALRQGREADCDEVVFLRGESTLRSDLVGLVTEARALGYGHIQVQTNGRLLSTGTLLADLVEAGVTTIEVVLLGPTARVHDGVAGVAGAFDETVAGLEAVVGAGVALLVTVPVLRANAATLTDTVALVAQLGAPVLQLAYPRPPDDRPQVILPPAATGPLVRAAVLLGRHLGLRVMVDALPPCLLGGIEPSIVRFPKTPTRVVDLHRGPVELTLLRRIYRPPQEACDGCAEVADCPGTWRVAVEELGGRRRLQAFPQEEEEEVDLCLIHPPWVVRPDGVPSQWDLLRLCPEAAPSRVEAQAGEDFAEAPMGVESIRRYLEARSSYRVRVVNLAGLYLGAADAHARLTAHLRRLRARVFAVDLQWLVHVQGALEVVRLCRELHPEARTVLGGLTASYFAREILEAHPEVDFVIAGDGERPLLRLLDALVGDGHLPSVSNLWYRRKQRVSRTRGSYHAQEESDYRGLPFVPVRRGCHFDCAHCGVGQTATRAIFGSRVRHRYAPEKVAHEILASCGLGGRAHLVGDPIATFGPRGMRRFLAAMGTRGAELELGLEFQVMHDKTVIDLLARTFRQVRISFRPDSGDETVRQAQGKPYSNEELLRCIRAAGSCGNVSVAAAFTFGLAKDNAATLQRTLELLGQLLAEPTERPLEVSFDELWALSPGSPALLDPATHGYRVAWDDLTAFRRTLPAPLFSGAVHFSPGQLSRREYLELVLQKHLEVNRLLRRHGRRDPTTARRVEAYVKVVRANLEAYERGGPGGVDLPAAEATRLGHAMHEKFLTRALA